MPLISRIVNKAGGMVSSIGAAITGKTAAQGPSQTQGQTSAQTLSSLARESGAMPTPIPSRTVMPEAPRDPFVAEFTVAPFFEIPVWYSGNWIGKNYLPSVELAEWILDELRKAGDALPDTAKAELIKIAIEWGRLEGVICDNNVFGSVAQFHTQNAAVRERLQAGKVKGVADDYISSREEIYQQSLIIRAECRMLQAALSKRVYEILKPFCDNVRKHARRLAAAQAKEEMGRTFGFLYRPSAKLISLVWLGIVGWEWPINNYMENAPSLRPPADWFGCQLFNAPRTAADDKIDAAKKEAEEIRKSRDDAYAREVIRRVTGEEISKKERDAEVEKLNSLHDKWREEGIAEAARIKAQRAEIAAAPMATAIERLLGKLTPAQPAPEPPSENKTAEGENENGNTSGKTD